MKISTILTEDTVDGILKSVAAKGNSYSFRQVSRLAQSHELLLNAIKDHHAQKADDRCIFDDDKLYTAAGLPTCDRRVGNKLEMVANCARFIDKRCEEGGWPSYVEIEKDLNDARKIMSQAAGLIERMKDPHYCIKDNDALIYALCLQEGEKHKS